MVLDPKGGGSRSPTSHRQPPVSDPGCRADRRFHGLATSVKRQQDLRHPGAAGSDRSTVGLHVGHFVRFRVGAERPTESLCGGLHQVLRRRLNFWCEQRHLLSDRFGPIDVRNPSVNERPGFLFAGAHWIAEQARRAERRVEREVFGEEFAALLPKTFGPRQPFAPLGLALLPPEPFAVRALREGRGHDLRCNGPTGTDRSTDEAGHRLIHAEQSGSEWRVSCARHAVTGHTTDKYLDVIRRTGRTSTTSTRRPSPIVTKKVCQFCKEKATTVADYNNTSWVCCTSG